MHFKHVTTCTGFGMILVGARGAIHVRGKDCVHLENAVRRLFDELFSRPESGQRAGDSCLRHGPERSSHEPEPARLARCARIPTLNN